MKQLLLIFTLFCASYMTVNAQTNTWTGAGANTNWNTTLNWSLNAVPTASNDVVIPTGFTVNLNVGASIKSLTVNGNSIFEMNNSLTFTNTSAIATGATFNWNSNSISGTTLTMNGTMNLNTAGEKYLRDATIINNSGTINFPASCLLYLYNTAQINNLASGTIDIKSSPIILSANAGTRQITNMGLLRKSMDSGDSQIQVALTNSGTITVSAGNLIMNSEAKTFNGGVYNVTTGSTLTWGTVINVSGNLTGALNGPINWTGTVSSATIASFNFTGTTQVNWSSGTLNGNGVLNNASTIHLPTAGEKYFRDDTVLNNTGLIDFPDSCLFYLYDTAILNNQQTGTIDIKSAPIILPGNGGTRHINNLGLLRKSVDTGNSQIQVALTNSGTINVLAGNLTMSSETKTFNAGIYNVSAGSTLTWGSVINISGSLTGALNGPINWTGTVSSAATATFNFTGSAQVNWSSGSLLGNGILNNASTIHLATAGEKYFREDTVLNNTGLIDFPTSCLFYLYDTATLNNQQNGTLDIKSASIILSANAGSRHINNLGLLKKSADNGTAEIQTLLTNSGVITVQAGSLNMTSETKTLNGGVYNVSVNSSLGWLTTIQVANTLTGLLNGPINWTGTVSVVDTATFNFTGSTQVNWSSGTLLGDGVLNNASTIHLPTQGEKYFRGSTELNNTGLIDFPDSCLLYFYESAVLNNEQNGVVDIKSAPIILPATGGTRHFNNMGLLKKSADDGVSQIQVLMTNSGTITVQVGTLNMTSETKTFNGGVYNVSTGSTLGWVTTIEIGGTLSGLLNGPINWTGTVSVDDTATFNFTGNAMVNWSNGTLQGDGVLNNASTIHLPTQGEKYFRGTTVLSNTGLIDFPTSCLLYFYDSATLNNQPNGVLDIKSATIILPATAGAHAINNAGLFKKSADSGLSSVRISTTNSGTIDASFGTLEFTNAGLNNTVDGIIKGTATLRLPPSANFTNNGTFAPGGFPGVLTVLGDFKSTATSVLDVELFGLVPITGYDVLAITGNAVFNGIVNVNLSFAPVLNNEFVIATTTGSITQCNLASTTSAEFNGMQYTFNVLCRNGNQVVLKVTNVTLGIDDSEISDTSVVVFPNPTNNYVTLKNKSNIDLTSATLVDISGRILKMIDLKGINNDVQISLEGYAIGTYFLKIEAPNASIVKQVIKK